MKSVVHNMILNKAKATIGRSRLGGRFSWYREKDGKKLVVYYFTSAGGLGDTLIPIAKENYKEIGIDLQVEQMDFNALLSRVGNGDHDFASFSTTMLTDPIMESRIFIRKVHLLPLKVMAMKKSMP